MDIGPAIKQRRQERAWTLAQLSEASGVSQGMLSEIECGKKNPTIKVVFQIANALDCTISELIEEEVAPKVWVVRKEERRRLVDPDRGIERHSLSPMLAQRGVQVVHYTLPPRAETEEYPPERPGIVEHITVLKGRMRTWWGEECITLEEGDSVTAAADVTHKQENLGDDPVEFVLVVDSTRAARSSGVMGR